MLEVKSISSGYGSLPVVRSVSLSVSPGEIVLLAGENGAGKSTLLRTIAGFIKPTAGNVQLYGEDITGWQPDRVARAGLRLVLDGHRVFPELRVVDNLWLGMPDHLGRREFEQSLADVAKMFPVITERLHVYARELSGGQQQMLALSQAFLRKPKVILCDEPSLGLAQALLPSILSFLKQCADGGAAVLIVEQHVKMAAAVADRTLVVDRGQIVQSKAAAAA